MDACFFDIFSESDVHRAPKKDFVLVKDFLGKGKTECKAKALRLRKAVQKGRVLTPSRPAILEEIITKNTGVHYGRLFFVYGVANYFCRAFTLLIISLWRVIVSSIEVCKGLNSRGVSFGFGLGGGVFSFLPPVSALKSPERSGEFPPLSLFSDCEFLFSPPVSALNRLKIPNLSI